MRPLNPGPMSDQLSVSDARTGGRQGACPQEAEVPGVCELNTAIPLRQRQAKDPGAQAWFLVCPTVLLPLAPARTSPGRTSVHPLLTPHSPQIQTQTLLNHCPHLLPPVYCSGGPLVTPKRCLYRETSTAGGMSNRLKGHDKPELNTPSFPPPKCSRRTPGSFPLLNRRPPGRHCRP